MAVIFDQAGVDLDDEAGAPVLDEAGAVVLTPAPPVLPGTSPGLIPAGVTPPPLLAGGSPRPLISLDYAVEDIFTDEFGDEFGVSVLLTPPPTVLPGTSGPLLPASAGPLLPPPGPRPLIPLDFAVTDEFTDVFSDEFGVTVLLTPAPPVLPGSTPRPGG
jgi:hypothetical protein